jgi:hypothetical protein
MDVSARVNETGDHYRNKSILMPDPLAVTLRVSNRFRLWDLVRTKFACGTKPVRSA